VYQKAIHEVLGPLTGSTALVYLDDILTASTTVDDGLHNLRLILTALRAAHLTLRLEKCRFLQPRITYLGHEIDRNGIRPGHHKIRAVINFPHPKTTKQIRQFLGLTSYFRKFIKNFSVIMNPISKLLRKGEQFVWGDQQEQAFQLIKQKLSEKPVLATYQSNAATELHCDASQDGLGATLLQQQDDGTIRPIMYFSQKTTEQERRYHSYELETLAIVRALQRFRIYLYGQKFKIITDCNALRYTLMKKDLLPRIARWWLLIQQFTFNVEYRPGCKMSHVDALSRNPVDIPQEDDMLTAGDVNSFTIGVTEEDWLYQAQMQDPKCAELFEILNMKPTSSYHKEIHKNYEIRNKRIYKRTPEGPRWLVPCTVRKQIAFLNHDENSHPGLGKTEESIRLKY
jgi:hypothetical protein